MNFCQKEFDLDKTRSFYDLLKTWKSYFLEVDPCRWSQGRHAQSCDVDSGTCDFRRDSSIVHTKCSLQALVQITKLNQVRSIKPEVTCSWIYVTTHSKPREDWCEWWSKMLANLNVLRIAFWGYIEKDKKIKEFGRYGHFKKLLYHDCHI